MSYNLISDIANGIELGENKRNNCLLLEDMYPGYVVLETVGGTLGDVITITNATVVGRISGILGQRYDQHLDQLKGSGIESWYVTQGYAPCFIEDPGADMPIGTKLYAGVGATVNPGYLSTVAAGNAVAELIEQMYDGDTVGIVKLLRG